MKDKTKSEKQVEELNQKLKDKRLSDDLEENITCLKDLFNKDETFIIRRIQNKSNPELNYAIAYCSGMIDNSLIGENIIKPLTLYEPEYDEENFLKSISEQILFSHGIKETKYIGEIVSSVTYGDVILLMPEMDKALLLSAQGFQFRSITEPESEKILSGPREGFCEALNINLTLIHRRLRTNEVKMQFRTFGERSNTKACICYMESLVNPDILKELIRRLDTIDIDGLLDVNYLTELIRDNSMSPFRSIGYTERPDVVVGKILEGRIALFLDGTPVVLTLPYLFIENFQSPEDYYLNFYYTSFSRILRVIGFCLSIMVPSAYLAITTHHHEILPTPLLISISTERMNVPFPMILEILIMLIIFDVLREAGVRMPAGVGQAMSVVGALVLGQSAVEANLVSSLVIIVVALSGITSLLIQKLNAAVIFARFFLLFLSAFMGLPGVTLGIIFIITHILQLKSFGVSQTTLTGDLKYQEIKDIVVRAPVWNMINRPRSVASDVKRMDRTQKRWWK